MKPQVLRSYHSPASNLAISKKNSFLGAEWTVRSSPLLQNKRQKECKANAQQVPGNPHHHTGDREALSPVADENAEARNTSLPSVTQPVSADLGPQRRCVQPEAHDASALGPTGSLPVS